MVQTKYGGDPLRTMPNAPNHLVPDTVLAQWLGITITRRSGYRAAPICGGSLPPSFSLSNHTRNATEYVRGNRLRDL